MLGQDESEVDFYGEEVPWYKRPVLGVPLWALGGGLLAGFLFINMLRRRGSDPTPVSGSSGDTSTGDPTDGQSAEILSGVDAIQQALDRQGEQFAGLAAVQSQYSKDVGDVISGVGNLDAQFASFGSRLNQDMVAGQQALTESRQISKKIDALSANDKKVASDIAAIKRKLGIKDATNPVNTVPQPKPVVR